MFRPVSSGICVGLFCATIAAAYVRLASDSNTGTPLFRPDSRSIAFLVNTSILAGARNSEGGVMLTASSNPLSALTSAESAWEGITGAAIRFLPLVATTLQNNPDDG